MPKITTVPAASFKARCLELMDRARANGETSVVMTHGKPVVRVVASEVGADRPFFGSMAGTVIEYHRPFDPIPGKWDIDAILNPPSRSRKRKARKRR